MSVAIGGLGGGALDGVVDGALNGVIDGAGVDGIDGVGSARGVDGSLSGSVSTMASVSTTSLSIMIWRHSWFLGAIFVGDRLVAKRLWSWTQRCHVARSVSFSCHFKLFFFEP